jgi:hypothetical protein
VADFGACGTNCQAYPPVFCVILGTDRSARASPARCGQGQGPEGIGGTFLLPVVLDRFEYGGEQECHIATARTS